MNETSDVVIKMKRNLDSLYTRFNHRQFVNPDPLVFLYDYPKIREREIAGLIAACLAYGRVGMILDAVSMVLKKLGPSPRTYVLEQSRKDMNRDFRGFRYRFAGGEQLVSLLWGIRQVLYAYSSLEACFCSGIVPGSGNCLAGLAFFFKNLSAGGTPGHLLADPAKGSACKRGHLYLRWMVRKDAVDPGGWDRPRPSELIIPLDIHMHRAGRILGLTCRKAADLKTAVEITAGFRRFSADDPVKYDFCLTRFGIRPEVQMDDLKEMVCR